MCSVLFRSDFGHSQMLRQTSVQILRSQQSHFATAWRKRLHRMSDVMFFAVLNMNLMRAATVNTALHYMWTLSIICVVFKEGHGIQVFYDVTPWQLVITYRRFEETSCLQAMHDKRTNLRNASNCLPVNTV